LAAKSALGSKNNLAGSNPALGAAKAVEGEQAPAANAIIYENTYRMKPDVKLDFKEFLIN
jgi:hypothetical protein